MYGNEGDQWVLVKPLTLGRVVINEVGEIFKIGQYYSVPHGYTSIEDNDSLIYIRDKIFEEHFVKKQIYDLYKREGSVICINANGNLGKYTIEDITGDGQYVTLQLKQN